MIAPPVPEDGALIPIDRVPWVQWTQGQVAGANSDFNTTISGTTAPFAVRDWYAANRKAFYGGAAAAATGESVIWMPLIYFVWRNTNGIQ